MADFSIDFVRSTARELQALPPWIQQRMLTRTERLQIDPFDGAIRLRGSDRHYRIRVGHYRIVYTVDLERRRILVTRVRHRKDAYR